LDVVLAPNLKNYDKCWLIQTHLSVNVIYIICKLSRGGHVRNKTLAKLRCGAALARREPQRGPGEHSLGGPSRDIFDFF